eukprot:1885861-Rhodomonas_salina.2
MDRWLAQAQALQREDTFVSESIPLMIPTDNSSQWAKTPRDSDFPCAGTGPSPDFKFDPTTQKRFARPLMAFKHASITDLHSSFFSQLCFLEASDHLLRTQAQHQDRSGIVLANLEAELQLELGGALDPE